MNAQRHVANRINLRACRSREAAGFQQHQIRIAQYGSESVVDVVAHIEHKAAQHGLAFQLSAGLFGDSGSRFGLCTVHGFAGCQNQSI